MNYYLLIINPILEVNSTTDAAVSKLYKLRYICVNESRH